MMLVLQSTLMMMMMLLLRLNLMMMQPRSLDAVGRPMIAMRYSRVVVHHPHRHHHHHDCHRQLLAELAAVRW